MRRLKQRLRKKPETPIVARVTQYTDKVYVLTLQL
jgi:hypothetical protein